MSAEQTTVQSRTAATAQQCWAAVLVDYGGVDAVQVRPVPTPVANPGQVLVRVEAAGVNPFDLALRRGAVQDAFPARFPHVMGLEFAGVVTALGDGVTDPAVGDRVMGELRWPGGALSQYVAADVAKVCPTPPELSALQAAAIPSVALTAWGALRVFDEPRADSTVLVHGASGAVGAFVVQFAAALGARTFGTASARNADYVLQRGAERVFARESEHPGDALSDVDVIVDCAGNGSVDELWSLLAPDGVVVSVADPQIEQRAPAGVEARWYKMDFHRDDLHTIARDVAAGRLRSTIAEVLPFDEAPAAIELLGDRREPGKVVVAVD